MEKQGKTTREMIAAVYQEAEDWILNGHGGAVLMADRDNGDIWADFFVDQGSRKIYHSSSVITVPVNEIFWKASNDRPMTKAERVDAVYRWYQTHTSPDVSPDQAMDGSNRIEIPCAGGVSLVAERNEDNNYNEIFIGLEKDGVWIQDLAVARQAYTYQKQSTFPVHTAGEYEVFVWKNEDSEDCTHEIRILQRKDTEESICSTEGYGIRQR